MRKLSENEIKKALECCTHIGYYTNCPGCPLEHTVSCIEVLSQNAIVLINRKDAQIVELNNKINGKR